MITHPITNRARHRVTSLIETNALPLSPAATQVLVYQVIAAVLLARVLFFARLRDVWAPVLVLQVS